MSVISASPFPFPAHASCAQDVAATIRIFERLERGLGRSAESWHLSFRDPVRRQLAILETPDRDLRLNIRFQSVQQESASPAFLAQYIQNFERWFRVLGLRVTRSFPYPDILESNVQLDNRIRALEPPGMRGGRRQAYAVQYVEPGKSGRAWLVGQPSASKQIDQLAVFMDPGRHAQSSGSNQRYMAILEFARNLELVPRGTILPGPMVLREILLRNFNEPPADPTEHARLVRGLKVWLRDLGLPSGFLESLSEHFLARAVLDGGVGMGLDGWLVNEAGELVTLDPDLVEPGGNTQYDMMPRRQNPFFWSQSREWTAMNEALVGFVPEEFMQRLGRLEIADFMGVGPISAASYGHDSPENTASRMEDRRDQLLALAEWSRSL